jgi:hypothetical protein
VAEAGANKVVRHSVVCLLEVDLGEDARQDIFVVYGELERGDVATRVAAREEACLVPVENFFIFKS